MSMILFLERLFQLCWIGCSLEVRQMDSTSQVENSKNKRNSNKQP